MPGNHSWMRPGIADDRPHVVGRTGDPHLPAHTSSLGGHARRFLTWANTKLLTCSLSLLPRWCYDLVQWLAIPGREMIVGWNHSSSGGRMALGKEDCDPFSVSVARSRPAIRVSPAGPDTCLDSRVAADLSAADPAGLRRRLVRRRSGHDWGRLVRSADLVSGGGPAVDRFRLAVTIDATAAERRDRSHAAPGDPADRVHPADMAELAWFRTLGQLSPTQGRAHRRGEAGDEAGHRHRGCGKVRSTSLSDSNPVV